MLRYFFIDMEVLLENIILDYGLSGFNVINPERGLPWGISFRVKREHGGGLGINNTYSEE